MQATRETPRPAAEAPLVRAAGYALLARALAYPDAKAHAALREVAELARDLLAGTPLADLARLAAGAEREWLESSHVRLFTVSASPDCPTFETAFLSTDPGQQTARMADIAGFYRAFGVDPASPGFRHDDICVELEFMGYLCGKEAHAAEHLGAPRVRQTVKAQRTFLKEHLGRWGAPLGRRIAARALAEPFYFTAGEGLADWLLDECERLATGPIDYIDEPAMEWEAPGADTTDFDMADEDPVFAPDDLEVI